MKVIPIGSLRLERFRFLTRKCLTQRMLVTLRKAVTREESLQKWPAPLFFCSHLLLLAPIKEKMLVWMELLHTESSSSALYSPVTSIASCFQPRFHAVPGLLKRDCKHQGTLLLMRSSMTAAGNPCRNMCCAQGSRQQQYPGLLPSLPSSTCN